MNNVKAMEKVKNKKKLSGSRENLKCGISRCCFAQDANEMHQSVNRTCRAIVFLFLIKQVVLLRSRCRPRRLKFDNVKRATKELLSRLERAGQLEVC